MFVESSKYNGRIGSYYRIIWSCCHLHNASYCVQKQLKSTHKTTVKHSHTAHAKYKSKQQKIRLAFSRELNDSSDESVCVFAVCFQHVISVCNPLIKSVSKFWNINTVGSTLARRINTLANFESGN